MQHNTIHSSASDSTSQRERRRPETRSTTKKLASPAVPRTPGPEESCSECTSRKYCHAHVFRFLDLPTELRVIIYQKALQRDEPVNLARKLPTVIVKSAHRIQATLRVRRRRQLDSSDSDSNEGYDVNAARNKRVPRPARDPLTPQLLLVCKQVYQEALPVLYQENVFNLHLEFSILPLTGLQQRTRSLIKHATITINEHGDVLNGGFADLFTNGLRYCFGLVTLEILTRVPMPRDRGYDLNFHILRWLPKGCRVEVKGERVSEGVKKMVDEQNMLAQKLDLVGGSRLPSYMRVSTWSGSETSREPYARPYVSHDLETDEVADDGPSDL